MKKLLVIFFTVAILLSSGIIEARGSRSSNHSSSYNSYKPQKLYSCPNCNQNDHYVSPHVRKNGEYVQGHMKTDRNNTHSDNFTQDGNINPYTGVPGYKD